MSTVGILALLGGSLVVVVTIALIGLAVFNSNGPGSSPSARRATALRDAGSHDPYVAARPAPRAVVSAIERVARADFAAVGSGGAGVATVGKPGSGASIVPIATAALSSGGKPEVVYVGAEYCPYCAAARWPLTVALSRFGSFRGLDVTASSPLVAYGDTDTLSFKGAAYKSKYLTFRATEEYSNVCEPKDVISNEERDPGSPEWESPEFVCNNGAFEPLEKLAPSVSELVAKVDSVPDFGRVGADVIPFVDFGGRYAFSGAAFSPAVLRAKSWTAIAGSLSDPSSTVGKTVLEAANTYTAILCELTGNRPPAVCGQAVIKSAEARLSP